MEPLTLKQLYDAVFVEFKVASLNPNTPTTKLEELQAKVNAARAAYLEGK